MILVEINEFWEHLDNRPAKLINDFGRETHVIVL